MRSAAPTWKWSLEDAVVVGALVGAPLTEADGRCVDSGHVGSGGGRRREGVGVGGDAAFCAATRHVTRVRPRPVATLLQCLLLPTFQITVKNYC